MEEKNMLNVILLFASVILLIIYIHDLKNNTFVSKVVVVEKLKKILEAQDSLDGLLML
jgi:uncharacterized membrane protein YvbJ